MDDPGPVSGEHGLRASRRTIAIVALGVATVCLLLFAGTRAKQLQTDERSEASSTPATMIGRPPVSRLPIPAKTPEVAFTARAFAGPGPDDPAGPGLLPHPITAEHLRIYRDVDLLEGAFRALERRDFVRARDLLAQHAREYASGYDDLQDGLTILADCMERPVAETRERAQQFYDRHTASTARRRIRRHCLEQVPAPPAVITAQR